ncbi:hypothetical protein SPBRAN_342 [uncultured Candidatus Thioglobus sp.]|nr:hypothetical protein SPBRAN_342 [uncultured Candidatus Thioglobus sp.]
MSARLVCLFVEYGIRHFIKTCRSPAGTGFNKIPKLEKSVILLIIPIYTKAS